MATTYVEPIALSGSASFTTINRATSKLSVSLWTVQALLALSL